MTTHPLWQGQGQGLDVCHVPEPIFVFLKSLPPAGTAMTAEKRAAMIMALTGLVEYFYGNPK